ncbi:MAG: sialidase [Bacillota bacterium]|nr:sialidase [Bacillota bacterium]
MSGLDLNISRSLVPFPSHHVYFMDLIQAESYFADTVYHPVTEHFKSIRSLEDRLIENKASEITDIYSTLEKYGVKYSLSRFLIKLVVSFTIKNSRKHPGTLEDRINFLFSDLKNTSQWVADVLNGYNVPEAVTEDAYKKVIKHTLEACSNNLASSEPSDWSTWEIFTGAMTSAPLVCCSGRNRLEVLSRGNCRHLYYKFMENGIWNHWEDTGISITSAPSAVITEDNILHVFALGNSNSLLHIEKTGNWDLCEAVSGDIISAPAVHKSSDSNIHIFCRGWNNNLMHIIRFGDGSWSNWEDLGGELTSAPSVVSWDGSRMDVFARGVNNSLIHISFSNNSWSPWKNLDGYLTSSPCSSSRAYNRIDIFARGRENQLIWKLWNGVSWSSWKDIGGYLTSRPSSVSWGPDRIDVLARGINNELIYICNK